MNQGTPTMITLDPPVPQPRPPQDGVEYNGKTGLWYNSSSCKNGCVEIGNNVAVPVKTVAVPPPRVDGPPYLGTPSTNLIPHVTNPVPTGVGPAEAMAPIPHKLPSCGTFLIIHHAPNWVVQATGEHGDSFQIADGGVGCPPPAKPGHGLEIALALLIVYLWAFGAIVMCCFCIETKRKARWRTLMWPVIWLWLL